MRILHLVHQYPPDDVGGTELYTRSLARELQRLDHDVGIFYRRNQSGKGLQRDRDDGVQLYIAQDERMSADRRFLATFGNSTLDTAWSEALDDFGPDLIHVQHLMGLPASLLSPIRARSLPLVITLHDYWWLCANAQLLTNYDQTLCPGPKAYTNCARCTMARANNPMLWPAAPLLPFLLAWRARVLRRWLDWASELIVSMDFVRDLYVDHGVDQARISVIPLGVDLRTEPVPRETSGPCRFLYVGGIAPQKGVHVVLEAFRMLQGHAELWIVGDENADPAYARRLRDLQSDGVCFLGRAPHARVAELMGQADMLVMPSLWYETFGLVIHEAFAAGLPVMASSLGVMAAAVRDDVDGILVAPGDVAAWQLAMQGVVDDPGRLARFRRAIPLPQTVSDHTRAIERRYVAAADAVANLVDRRRPM